MGLNPLPSRPPCSGLPPPRSLVWAHSVCTLESLTEALHDLSPVTAIETDILMGRVVTEAGEERGKDGESEADGHDDGGEDGMVIPIMAHPPNRSSDLSMERFLDDVTRGEGGERTLKRHVKLDFKEFGVVEPTVRATMRLIHNKDGRLDTNGKAIFLNADVLPGPGNRGGTARIDGDLFLRTCALATGQGSSKTGTTAITEAEEKKEDGAFAPPSLPFAYSLGWNVDYKDLGDTYTNGDIDKMRTLVEEHDLISTSAGIVLAVNGRILARDCAPFDSFLRDIESSQLLVFTGAGEPPIHSTEIDKIINHFRRAKPGEEQTFIDRIGFDCKIAEN